MVIINNGKTAMKPILLNGTMVIINNEEQQITFRKTLGPSIYLGISWKRSSKPKNGHRNTPKQRAVLFKRLLTDLGDKKSLVLADTGMYAPVCSKSLRFIQ